MGMIYYLVWNVKVESSRVESSRVESSRVESSRVESSRVESSFIVHVWYRPTYVNYEFPAVPPGGARAVRPRAAPGGSTAPPGVLHSTRLRGWVSCRAKSLVHIRQWQWQYFIFCPPLARYENTLSTHRCTLCKLCIIGNRRCFVAHNTIVSRVHYYRYVFMRVSCFQVTDPSHSLRSITSWNTNRSRNTSVRQSTCDTLSWSCAGGFFHWNRSLFFVNNDVAFTRVAIVRLIMCSKRHYNDYIVLCSW